MLCIQLIKLVSNPKIIYWAKMEELKEGYLVDFISGKEVKATPEETEAVQVFARMLVEDYDYPKELFKQDHNLE